jgi:hypothetical protein
VAEGGTCIRRGILNRCWSIIVRAGKIILKWIWWRISYSWINCKYIYTYKHVPLYHVTFRSRCIQQSMNQFSTTQRSVTTAAYVELQWSSLSNKLPNISILHLAEAKCGLSAAAAVCVHWVDVLKALAVLLQCGPAYLILLTEWRPEMY